MEGSSVRLEVSMIIKKKQLPLFLVSLYTVYILEFWSCQENVIGCEKDSVYL